jgi:hypothetical protein
MNKKVSLLVENFSEATVACLVTMVQGNVLSIGLGHLIIASQTGLAAGAIATIAVVVSKSHRRGLVALVLGVTTTVVDYLIHPGMFGSVFTEAIVTGVGAALLSLVVSTAIHAVRKRKAATPIRRGP